MIMPLKTSNPNPVFLLAGGPGSKTQTPDPLLKIIFETSGKSKPSIVYLGSASGDSRDFFQWTSQYFRQSGAGSVKLAPTVGRRVNFDQTKAIFESADMIYVSGGDVEEGMAVLLQKELLPFLRQLFDNGKPFFGLSAGSIMLARSWVRWDDPDDDATARIFPCLNFAPVLCDMHAEKEDWEELQVLLKLSPDGTKGYGIPSGGGLRVDANGGLKALGKPIHCYIKEADAVRRIADLTIL
jgi:peptidase E